MSDSSGSWTIIGDALGSWRLWALAAAVGTLTPFLALLSVQTGPAGTLVSAVVAALAMLAVAWSGWVLILRHLHGIARLAAAVPVVIAAGAVRGLVLQTLIGSNHSLRYWLVGSSLNVSIAVLTGLLVKAGIDGHRLRLEDLAAQQQRLSLMLASADSELRWSQSGAVDEVTSVVTEELAAIPQASPLLTVDSLEQVAAEVVRPLSYELAAVLPAWQPPPPAHPPPRLEWSRVWGSVADLGALDRWGAAVVLLAVTPASAFAMGLPAAVLMHLLAAAALMLGLSALRRLARARTFSGSTPVRLLVDYVLLAVACLPAAAVTVAFPGPPSGLTKALWIVLVLPLVALLLTIVRAGRVQQRELEAAARTAVQQTQWWISRTRMVGWWQRAVLARALHGPVQSALHAAAQRLRQAEQEGKATPAVVQQALDEVRARCRQRSRRTPPMARAWWRAWRRSPRRGGWWRRSPAM